MDAPALAIFGGLDIFLFAGTDVAVGGGIRFLAIDPGLPALEVCGLAVGQRTALHAILDALLLIRIALHIGLHALRRRGIRITRLRVMLLLIYILAHIVLRALDALLFRIGHLAVLERIRLHFVDLRLLAFEFS